MGTKTKPDATSELHLIMGEVQASAEMVVPSHDARLLRNNIRRTAWMHLN